MVRSIRAFTLRGACNVLLTSTQLVDTCVAFELAARSPSHWHVGEFHAHAGIPHVNSRTTRVATGGCAASRATRVATGACIAAASPQPVDTCVAFDLAVRSPSHWHIGEFRARVVRASVPHVNSRAMRVATGGCAASTSPPKNKKKGTFTRQPRPPLAEPGR